MTEYPGAIYSPRTKANKAGVVYDASKTTIGFVEDITKLDDEVVAIETELGTDPSGAYDTVKLWLTALAAAIVTTFLGLTDTPGDYSGEAGKYLKVNVGENALEFIEAPGVTEDQLKIITVELSAVNIIAMYGTPIIAIAAPGEGKIIIIDQAVSSFTYGGTQFTGGGEVKLAEETSLTAQTGDLIRKATLQGEANNIRSTFGALQITLVSNKAMLITNEDAAFADGDGTAKVFIRYRIITL